MLPEILVPHLSFSAAQDPHGNYYLAKEVDNVDGEGTYRLAMLRAFKYYDIRNRQPFYEPLANLNEVMRVARLKALLMEERALLNRGHVPATAIDYIGLTIQCFKSAFTAPNGRLPMPRKGDAFVGLHSVVMRGYDSRGNIHFANSWGQEWGDHGFGWMSPDYFDRYFFDAWRANNARYGLAPWKYDGKKPKDNKQFVRKWMVQNPRYRVRFRYGGQGHQFIMYDSLSATGAPVEIIDLCNGFGLRLGWAHIFHVRRDSMGIRTSIMKEFFVWPKFRRHGYGTLLEQEAVSRAEAFGSKRVQIPFHNIDSFPHVRDIGQSFVEKRGYICSWMELSRPSISGIAEKYLDKGSAE